jgi:hypothetical protein
VLLRVNRDDEATEVTVEAAVWEDIDLEHGYASLVQFSVGERRRAA